MTSLYGLAVQRDNAIRSATKELQDEINSLRQQVAELEADAKRWNYFIETCSAETAFELTGNSEASNEDLNEAIDLAMEKQNDN